MMDPKTAEDNFYTGLEPQKHGEPASWIAEHAAWRQGIMKTFSTLTKDNMFVQFEITFMAKKARTEIESKYPFKIVIEEGDYWRTYYARKVEFENSGYVRFVPLFEVSSDGEKEVEGEIVYVPLARIQGITQYMRPKS